MSTIQGKDLLKTEGIYKTTPNTTLKEALGKLTRTHDAIFVLDGKKFVGVINPYYTVFKSSFPPDTKLVRCLYKPPLITPSMLLWDIARLMVESKIYYLPVITNNSFSGIVTSNRILKILLTEGTALNQLNIQKKRALTTIKHNESLSTTYSLMRDKQVSRLPVVNNHNKLVGIVSRYDIQTALTEPKKRPRFMSRKGTKEKYLNHPIKGYYKKMVITASGSTSTVDIVKKMVENSIGSVVIVDRNHHPIGLVSTHDVLKAIAKLRPQNGPELEISADKDFLQQARLEEKLSRFSEKITKRHPVKTIHFSLKTEKNPMGKVRSFKTTGRILFGSKQKPVTATATDFDWKKATRKTLDKLEKQIGHHKKKTPK